MITFNQFDKNELLPVLHWPERQAEPQPAVIRIDAKTKTVTAIATPIESIHVHRRDFRIPNNITGRALNRVFEDAEFRRFCERIIDGYDAFVFYSDDAEAAVAELMMWLETNITDADCVQVMTANNFVRKHRKTLGITSETGNEAIAEIAEAVCEELAADNRAIAGGVEALTTEMIRYRNSLIW